MQKFTPLLLFFLLNTGVLLSQVDTVPPVLMCSAQSNYHGFGGLLTVWAPQFIDSLSDDQSENIEVAIRKSCTGDGFPEGMQYVIFTWETQCYVDIWARDEAGNTSTCTVGFMVNNHSSPSGKSIRTQTIPHDTVAAQNIWHVMYHADAVHCLSDSLSFDLPVVSNEESQLPFSDFPSAGYTIRLEASKNINPLNGVTANDLVLISRHILGLQPFNSPYKIIAADANQDGKVTMYDIVILRKLILGITDELPNGKSWRFIPENYVFSNPADPFGEPFPEYAEIPGTVELSLLYEPVFLKGIKIGDVNFSADPSQ